MGTHSIFSSRKILATCCGLGLAAGVLAFRAQADEWNKKTYLTVNKTIEVQDTVLPAGTYVFKLLDSPSARHVVQIFNRDETHLINTVMAIPNYRLQPTGHSRFTFYETPPGYAPALRAWFYPGDNFGQEFRYPKHLAMLETSTQQTETTRMNKQAEEEKKTETTQTTPQAEPPAPPPAPQEQAETKTEEQQPVEMAQNTPPPAPAPPAAEPQNTTPAPMPRQLPKTASPYPLIGLGGIFSLGLYGLLRLKRLA